MVYCCLSLKKNLEQKGNTRIGGEGSSQGSEFWLEPWRGLQGVVQGVVRGGDGPWVGDGCLAQPMPGR